MSPRCPCAECVKQAEDSPLEKGGQNEDDISPSPVSLGLFLFQRLFSLRFLAPLSVFALRSLTFSKLEVSKLNRSSSKGNGLSDHKQLH